MFITKDTPLNILEKATDADKIYIDKAVSLDTNLLELILQKFPNSSISIITSQSNLNYSPDVLYNHEELEVLAHNVNLARQKYNHDILFDDEFSIEQAIEASKKLNEWEKQINEATIDGKPLSPLEKFFIAYSIVSKRYYNLEKENENISLSRNIISVLNDDYICCAGFSNTLSNLCARIGVPCVCRTCSVWDYDEKEKCMKWTNHANCIVRIEDDKYNVHGFFNSDPTWDAIKSEYADQIDEIDYNFSFKHFLISHEDYLKRFPNIVLDRASTTNDKYIETPPKTKVYINDIQALYPEIKNPSTINATVFDPTTHIVDFDLLKTQTFERLCSLVESLPDVSQTEEPDFERLDATFEFLVSYFIQESVEHAPEDKGEYIYYIDEYFETLLSCFSKEQIIDIIKQQLDNTPISDIEAVYEKHRISVMGKNSNFEKCNFDYSVNRSKTEAVSEKTLLLLFKNIFPLMFDFKSKEELDKFSKIVLNKFSPIALLAEQKTPS